jgi:hypothetical protein
MTESFGEFRKLARRGLGEGALSGKLHFALGSSLLRAFSVLIESEPKL